MASSDPSSALRFSNTIRASYRASIAVHKALKALMQVSGGGGERLSGDQQLAPATTATPTISAEAAVKQSLIQVWHFWDNALKDGIVAFNECTQLLKPTSTPACQITENEDCSVLREKITIDLTH